MRRFSVLVLALALFVSLGASPAQAKFAVCNKTEHPFAIALGHMSGGKWVSEGWWRVEPKACQDILRGALKARYYYLRGVHLGVDGAWDGNRMFCVRQDNFTIKRPRELREAWVRASRFLRNRHRRLCDVGVESLRLNSLKPKNTAKVRCAGAAM